MKRRNISWTVETEALARSLARERGIAVSQLLSQLVEAEKNDARIAPSCDLCELSPGMRKLLEKRGGGIDEE